MKKRILALSLVIISVLQLLSGCSKEKTDEELYITKGEFFAYYVYENNMTSSKYTAEDIQNSLDGSVEAAIIVEWGYLTEKQATKQLNQHVDKETVVMVCANATFELKEGNVSDIKDADLLDDPQTIANAYASGFFELEKGYFNGAQKMTFADCEAIMDKAREYTANFHYEANTEECETAEDVITYDGANSQEGDVVIQLEEEEITPQTSVGSAPTIINLNSVQTSGATGVQNTVYNAGASKVRTEKVDFGGLNVPNIKGFTATIMKGVFEKDLGNPKVGDTIVFQAGQIFMHNVRLQPKGELIGILVSFRQIGAAYECIFEYPNFEQAVEKKNVEKGNASGIEIESFVKEKTEYMDWKLNFDVGSNSIKISAEKDFTVKETGRKQEYQNAKKTVHATANFTMEDFNVDVNNLRSFANKKGKGFVKVTCDTTTEFSLDSSLRYTPDDNRNGKFPSNWNNSRWTDSDSKGAKDIKIARFTPSLYEVVNVDVYIYLRISVDGKVSFVTSVSDGGVQIETNNGNLRCTKLGNKKNEVNANINLHGRVGVDTSLKIFRFINVIEYDVGVDLDANALVNLYYEDKLSKSGIYADEEGLNEYAADDDKFSYCIGVSATFSVSGELKDSGVKLILDCVSKGDVLNFEHPIWSWCIHFEDGAKVAECTRGNEDELEASKEDDVKIDTYKVTMYNYTCATVNLKEVPSETINLMDSKNSITVKSKNTNVVKVSYNKKSKQIILEAAGEGSTEIVITAKKGMWWWKETATQTLSVTVNNQEESEYMEMNYTIPYLEEKYEPMYL